MSPLPNTRVIPEGWAAHQRPALAGTRTASCTIRRPGVIQGAFDPETGTYGDPQPHDPHYTGTCRIQVEPIFAGNREAGGQQVTVAGYLVTVDLDDSADTEVDDVLKVTDPGPEGDPTLLDRELTVTGIARGSLAVERYLTCIDDLG